MDEEVIVLERNEFGVVVVPSEQVVTSIIESPVVITDELTSTVCIDRQEGVVIAVGMQGPPGTGGGGSSGEVFITDVVPTSTGIVGSKVMKDAYELLSALSDTVNVRVHFACEGGADKYKPDVEVNGILASLTETTTKRWFTGFADVVLQAGMVNTIEVVSDAGGSDTVDVEVLGVGPEVLSIIFGPYPGGQIELKMGDTISVTITTQPEATSVTVLAQGAVSGTTLSVSGGSASGVLTISNQTGSHPVSVKAQNLFGTFGNIFDSAPLTLNQTYPTVGPFSVSYPVTQQAIEVGETAEVTCPVVNFDIVTYSGSHIEIDSPDVFASPKTVTTNYVGYDGSGTNFTVTANRVANNSTTVGSTLVRVASIPPTASITIIGNPQRLSSSPGGIDYEIRIYPNQLVSATPSLAASHGVWQGGWSNMGAYWKRSLRIADSVLRGAGAFSALGITGPSGLAGSTITAGSVYTVGGFSSRSIVFPAFSRVASLGVAVGDQSKLTFSISGTSYTRYTDNAVHSAGFYPANSDGSYNPNGTYVGLSDSVFAGSNTTGTLEAVVQETA